jgi:hypothetical protein
VLAHILTTLNERYKYGLDLFLLSIDEGITGYRDDSLETVKRNEQQYGIPLKILSYKELYGWTMDEIVRAIGHRNNCTFCGVFRRQALDRGAALMKADKMATGARTLPRCQTDPVTTCSTCFHPGRSKGHTIHTACVLLGRLAGMHAWEMSCAALTHDGSLLVMHSGLQSGYVEYGARGSGRCCRCAGHNADDIAETVLLNILRGDVPRLGRCANIITGEDSAQPRVKPFKYTYEKEIVMYAFFKKLDYFSTECIYAPYAARGAAREFVKDLEVGLDCWCLPP